MSLQTIPPRPSALTSLLRLVHDRNPFYLLSALSMFVGFRVVLSALDPAAGDWRTLLGLIVTVNVYECLIIALALYLIVRRGLRRDGWLLLGIEALFLVDLTNLNAELFTALPRLGAVVSGACFLLALSKIGVVCRVLRLRLAPGTTLYIAAQLAFLLALPGTFRLMQTRVATVSPLAVYAVWWAAGALMAGGAVMVRRDPRTAGHPMGALPGRLFVLVPLVSLIVHLASENRVYWVHFQPANVAPVLLAGVVAIDRLRPRPAMLPWSLALVAVAVLVSIVPDEYRAEMSTHLAGLTITPLRAALAAATVVLVALAVWHHAWALGTAVVASAVLGLLGSSIAEIARRLARAAEWTWDLLWRAVPSTTLQWGYAAIAAAFLLLGVGAIVSLRTAPRRRPDVGPTAHGGSAAGSPS